MKLINYIIQAFGYNSFKEFNESAFHFKSGFLVSLNFGLIFGTIEYFSKEYLGLHSITMVAFVLLMLGEWHTGLLVALKVRKEKFQSRKLSRMLFKIGYYLLILFILKTFNNSFDFPTIEGFELDPFAWLYMVYLIVVVFSMVISVAENLGKLGYKESRTFGGLVLRKFNSFLNLEDSPNQDADEDLRNKSKIDKSNNT